MNIVYFFKQKINFTKTMRLKSINEYQHSRRMKRQMKAEVEFLNMNANEKLSEKQKKYLKHFSCVGISL